MLKRRLHFIILAVALLPLAACRLGGGTSSSIPMPPLSAATPTASTVGFAFKTSGYTLHAWPAEEELQTGTGFVANDPANRDSTGAIVRRINGHLYNHPVSLTQDGMKALAAYQETGDAADLRVALADATRLVEVHTAYADAWWYPYPFDWKIYGSADEHAIARAPWYSAMAQGEACDLFTRLYLQTHDAQWRTAADHTFASFLHPYSGDATVPWVVNVADGYLWLQEYPKPQPDYTINGAFYAIAGIAKYALTFQDARAALIADGAMTTMLAYTPKARHPGWILSYSLTHLWDQISFYHGVVTKQLLLMYTITRDTRFAALALQLIDDFPIPGVSGALTLPAGTYTLASPGQGDGQIGDQRQITLSSTTALKVDLRYKMRNASGAWYHISGGTYKGSWIQESATIHLADPVNVAHFSPPLPVTLTGTYHVYTLAQGQLQPAGTLSASAAPAITVSEHAAIGGVDVWQVASGQYAGQYLAGAAPSLAA